MKVSLFVLILFAGGCSTSGEKNTASESSKKPLPAAAAGRTLVTGTAPAGTLVMLEPLFEHDFPDPAGPAYMDQSGQMFIPEFLMARTGQQVHFRSSEDVLHNVRVDHIATKTSIFNVATPPWGMYPHTFDKPGFYNVSCDIHTTMRATILITATPYTMFAGETGSFTFQDVLPGSYKLKGFVEEEPVEKTVQIAGARTELSLQ
jgi:hypothetical protein